MFGDGMLIAKIGIYGSKTTSKGQQYLKVATLWAS